MMCRLVLAAVLSVAALPATAQVISKCPDGKGGHVYQDAPCEAGVAARQWDASAHRDTPDRIRRAEALNRQRSEQLAARSPAVVNNVVFNNGPSASQQQDSRCNAAKAHRQRELERLGLRRTYDILRNLNDYVTRECARR